MSEQGDVWLVTEPDDQGEGYFVLSVHRSEDGAKKAVREYAWRGDEPRAVIRMELSR